MDGNGFVHARTFNNFCDDEKEADEAESEKREDGGCAEEWVVNEEEGKECANCKKQPEEGKEFCVLFV